MELVEDFVDEIEYLTLIKTEISTKRNSFILLFHLDQNKVWAKFNSFVAVLEIKLY